MGRFPSCADIETVKTWQFSGAACAPPCKKNDKTFCHRDKSFVTKKPESVVQNRPLYINTCYIYSLSLFYDKDDIKKENRGVSENEVGSSRNS